MFPPLRSTVLAVLLLAAAASGADIPLGSTLTASDPNSRWTSPNSTFTLTFISTTPGNFIAAVTYSGVPIWSTPSAPSSSVLRLLPSGDLQLLPSPTSTDPLWSSSTAARNVSSAELQESGNFILKDSSGTAVWSTFDHPTDTVVPSQRFSVNRTLSSGLYSFALQRNGNLTLLWNNTVVYYNSGLNSTANSSFASPVLNMQPTGILTLSDPLLSSPLDLAYSSDYAEEGNILRFLKLDDDGNLRIYSSVSGSGTKTAKWAALSDQCEVFGFCGNLGICSYNETSPVCGCPSGNFELIDPKNARQGCKRKVELQNCPGNATMLQLDHTIFLTYEPELSADVFFQGTSPCRLNCLVGPCVASTSLADGSGLCYLKIRNFVSGYQSPAIPSTSFVKVCGPVVPALPAASTGGGAADRWKLRWWLVVVVIVATVFGLLAVEGGLWWWCVRNSPKFGKLSAEYALLEYASGAPVQFSYKELHRATKGFREKLGSGGFGAVYRGVLANRTAAAVKRLEGIEQGEKQFRMEVATISSTHHLNLVRLVGFCSEGKHRLLVYEFMKNGSLDGFLFGEPSSSRLSWDQRFAVALGTARGITYLHEECRDCIVHCDIKPENILLDESHQAKVSDFGLAKLVSPRDHRQRTLTSVRGTRGYLAPEWLANLPVTSKSDVYSYGMVLLEIVSGRRNFEVSEETGQRKFTAWAYEELERGNLGAILDRRLDGLELDMDQVARAVRVSFWCIQEQPSQRPTMGRVVQMLEGVVEIEPPPAPRGSNSGTSVTATSTSGSSTAVNAGVSSSASGKQGGEHASSSLLHLEQSQQR